MRQRGGGDAEKQTSERGAEEDVHHDEEKKAQDDHMWKNFEEVSPLLALIVMICTVGIPGSAWIFVFPSVWSSAQSGWVRAAHLLVAASLTMTVEYSYYRALHAPIESPLVEQLSDESRSKVLECKRCKRARRPNVHHCRMCNVCVDGHDHHCIWLLRCVGTGNQFFFFLYVCSTAIALVYVLWITYMTGKLYECMVTTMGAVFFLWLTVWMTAQQLYVLSTGISTRMAIKEKEKVARMLPTSISTKWHTFTSNFGHILKPLRAQIQIQGVLCSLITRPHIGEEDALLKAVETDVLKSHNSVEM
mmetsp:Transcript_14556/g.37151  ORF Transcript_14556/g.37151 Transcript_14556/m.37151 type:complete len:304 (-) Transcript_14556:149-1060(-)